MVLGMNSKKKAKSVKKTKKKVTGKKALKPAPHPKTLELVDERDIALDFATKAYQKFNSVVKSIVLFGSTVKQSSVPGSDIDVIIVVDDISIKWDQQTIAWYRKELENV